MLPVVPPAERPTPQFQSPLPDPQLPGYEVLDSGNVSGYAEVEGVQADPETGEAYVRAGNTGSQRFPWGVETFRETLEHRTSDHTPANTSVKGSYSLSYDLPDRTLEFEQDVRFESDEKNFRLHFQRRLKVDGKLQHSRQWDETIPRDFQ